MDLWDRINETISIVLWPVVVGLALVLFRDEIRDLIGRVREWSALGVSFKAAERAPQVNSGFLSDSVAIAAGVEPDAEQVDDVAAAPRVLTTRVRSEGTRVRSEGWSGKDPEQLMMRGSRSGSGSRCSAS